MTTQRDAAIWVAALTGVLTVSLHGQRANMPPLVTQAQYNQWQTELYCSFLHVPWLYHLHLSSTSLIVEYQLVQICHNHYHKIQALSQPLLRLFEPQ